MQPSPFREKNRQRISTPQEMNDYMRVTKPSLWILLAAILVFLIGVLVWCVQGRMETTQPVAIQAEDGKNICYILYDKMEPVQVGTVVRSGDTRYTVAEVCEEVYYSEDLDQEVCAVAQFSSDVWVGVLVLDGKPVSGTQSGYAVLESIPPIQILFQ